MTPQVLAREGPRLVRHQEIEGLSKGEVVDEVASGSGINGDLSSSAQVFGSNAGFEAGTNAAMIFDATCNGGCSGGDDDLNKPESGNVLIISENLDSDDPDDANQGGLVKFDFSGLGAGKLTGEQLDVLDVEDGGTIVLRAGGEEASIVDTFPIHKMADNGLDTILIGATGVDFMSVNIIGSGALDNIQLKIGKGTRVLASDLATPPVNIGPGSTPDYETLAEAAVHNLDGDAGGGLRRAAG